MFFFADFVIFLTISLNPRTLDWQRSICAKNHTDISLQPITSPFGQPVMMSKKHSGETFVSVLLLTEQNGEFL